MATHTIYIQEEWLSDGSAVYSVRVKDHDKPNEIGAKFDAVDRGAAYRMAEQMKKMFNDTRNALADVEVSDQTYV